MTRFERMSKSELRELQNTRFMEVMDEAWQQASEFRFEVPEAIRQIVQG